MAPNTIQISTVVKGLLLVLISEAAGGLLFHLLQPAPLLVTGAVRLVQGAILLRLVHRAGGLSLIGLSVVGLPKGLRLGLRWSYLCGGLAAIVMAVIYLAGRNPLLLLRTPLPADRIALFQFFIVGGLIAPLTEEIFFRGLLYTYFRRWGVAAALTAVTLIFAALHIPQGVPVVPAVGGIVFAVAYESSRNLVVPIVIHILGNLTIFALSLPLFF